MDSIRPAEPQSNDPRAPIRRRLRDLRDLVYQNMVDRANYDPAFKRVVDPLGFFSFMSVVDGVVDAVIASEVALRMMPDKPWRVGRSVGRTIYDSSDALIGIMDTPDLAKIVVAAVNAWLVADAGDGGDA